MMSQNETLANIAVVNVTAADEILVETIIVHGSPSVITAIVTRYQTQSLRTSTLNPISPEKND